MYPVPSHSPLLPHRTDQIRVAVLDNHPTLLQLLAERLAVQPGLTLCGAWTHSDGLLAGLADNPVDVVLMEYSLGNDDIDSSPLISQIRQRHPQVRILVFSAHDSALIIAGALQAGAHGYLCRTADWPTLIDAIGHLTTVQRRPARTRPTYPDPEMRLSPRERDVLRHSLAGASVSTLARLQGLSEKTISTQKRAAYRKLGLHGDADLFRLADLVMALVDEAPATSRPHAA